jgi:hypothetical protein
LIAAAQGEQRHAQNSDVPATGHAALEDLEGSDDFGGLRDRFASPGQQMRQDFSKQTHGAVPVSPQPYGQQRWVRRKV